MYKILKETCDFKIIPGNFKSSGSLEILSIDKDIIEAKVELLDQNEMADYVVNSNVTSSLSCILIPSGLSVSINEK